MARAGRCISIVIVLAAFAVLPRAVAGQDATPWPESVREAFIDGGVREFRSAEMRLLGPAAIAVGAYRFDTEQAADDALPFLRSHFSEQLGGALQPASAPDIGDETQALAGESPGTDDSSYPVGLLTWRDGPVVFIAFSAGLAGEQLPALFNIAHTIDERSAREASGATPVGDQGMRAGGIWDRLPRLDDMPEGFVLESETPIAKP